MKERPLWEKMGEAIKHGLPKNDELLSECPLSMLAFNLSARQMGEDDDHNEYTGLGVFDVAGRAVGQALTHGHNEAAQQLWMTLANSENICSVYGCSMSQGLDCAMLSFIQHCSEHGELEPVVLFLETMVQEQKHKPFVEQTGAAHILCAKDACEHIINSVLIDEGNKAQLISVIVTFG